MTDNATAAPATPGAGDDTRSSPPWAEGEEMPDISRYIGAEPFVAGALSVMEPFRSYHPAWALPFARRALEALSEWDPDE